MGNRVWALASRPQRSPGSCGVPLSEGQLPATTRALETEAARPQQGHPGALAVVLKRQLPARRGRLQAEGKGSEALADWEGGVGP